MPAPVGFVRKLRALQRIVRPAGARAVALALLLKLAKKVAPELSMPRYRCAYPKHAQKSIDSIADFLAKHPLEEAAYFLSCVYAVLCDPTERRELAMYFTPPKLARHIIEGVQLQTSTFCEQRFLDPACGGAAFLLPVATILRDSLRKRGVPPRELVRIVNRQIAGVEKDATLAELCRQFIRIALADELTACRQELGEIVTIGDALECFTRKKLAPVNILLCNPPYRKISANELAWYRQRFPEVIAGQPNLYTMFMRAASGLVVPGGLIALLTPTSYFSGPTYERIRAHYTRHCGILRIDLIHERDNLFLGVEHDVAALLARRRLTPAPRQAPAVFAWNEVGGWASLGAVELPRDEGPWHLPRDVTSADALVKSKRQCASLQDYGYKARVGVYVWNRDKRRVRKARPKGRDRKIAVPVVWATHIGQDGRFRFVSRTHKEKRARFILLRPGDRRGVIERDCVLIQRTSSRAQRRRLVAAAPRRGFAKRHGGFVGENHIIILEPILDRPLVPRHMLTRLLNSEFIRDLYSTTTGTTAVTTAGLRALPLPDPRLLKELVGRRHSLKQAIRTAFGARTTNKHSNMDDAKATAP